MLHKKLPYWITIISETEVGLESLRQVLCEIKEMEPYQAFLNLDFDTDGVIGVNDIMEWMKINNCDINIMQAECLHNQIDINQDGVANYQDFIQYVLPKEDYKLKLEMTLRHIRKVQQLPSQAAYALTRLFQHQIYHINHIKLLTEDLIRDHSIYEIFQVLESSVKGFINEESISNYMRQENNTLVRQEVLAFIRACDIDQDQQISYQDLVQVFKKLINTTIVYKKPLGTIVQAQNSHLGKVLKDQSTDKLTDIQNQDKLKERDFSADDLYKNRIWTTPPKRNVDYELVTTLNEFIQLERQLEDIKKQLALQTDFTLMHVFRHFDIENSGLLNQSSLGRELQKLSVNFNSLEMNLLFKHYDNDKDGQLRFSEFARLIIPNSAEYAHLVNNRKNNRDNTEKLCCDTLFLLKTLFEKHFSTQVQAEDIRKSLNRRCFSIHQAFQTLDRDKNGYVTLIGFRNLLNEYGIYASTNELVSLVMRYDKNCDGKVSLSEFVKEMSPQSQLKF